MSIYVKRHVLLELLEAGEVRLIIDPTADGVMVPDAQRHDRPLILDIGYAMALPIPDLCIGPHGIEGTLSFNRSPFRVSIPWAALFAVAQHEGVHVIWGFMEVEVEAEPPKRPGLSLVPPSGEGGHG